MRCISLKLIYSCVVLATFCGVCSAQKSWLLQESNGSWTRFNRESDWQKATQGSRPLETAVVNQTSTRISVVYDVEGESGDWRNIDRYTFLLNGTLVKLQRKFGSVSQDILITQVLELDASGKLKETSENEESLNTGKAKKEAAEKPQIPIATNIRQLDFMKALK